MFRPAGASPITVPTSFPALARATALDRFRSGAANTPRTSSEPVQPVAPEIQISSIAVRLLLFAEDERIPMQVTPGKPMI